jgi:hypothetical protein
LNGYVGRGSLPSALPADYLSCRTGGADRGVDLSIAQTGRKLQPKHFPDLLDGQTSLAPPLHLFRHGKGETVTGCPAALAYPTGSGFEIPAPHQLKYADVSEPEVPAP